MERRGGLRRLNTDFAAFVKPSARERQSGDLTLTGVEDTPPKEGVARFRTA
jgi:hypothetical protein